MTRLVLNSKTQVVPLPQLPKLLVRQVPSLTLHCFEAAVCVTCGSSNRKLAQSDSLLSPYSLLLLESVLMCIRLATKLPRYPHCSCGQEVAMGAGEVQPEYLRKWAAKVGHEAHSRWL
jgi:hypothetical protein